MATLNVRIRFAWWFKPYVYGLAAMAAITGREPDWTRVNRVIDRAVQLISMPKPSRFQRIALALRAAWPFK